MSSDPRADRSRIEAAVYHLGATYALARDDFGEEYFIYPRNFQSFGPQFADIQHGTRLQFIPIQHPKGWRGIEIRILEV